MTRMAMSALITVVTADDHPMFRESIVRAIGRDHGLALVAEADDGRAALDAIREHHPDVAVVDLRMPGLDGAQIVAAVRTEAIPTKVIVLSGQIDDADVVRALQLGAAGVLSKVAGAEALLDAIHSVAAGATVIAPELAGHLAAGLRARADDRPALSTRELEVLQRVAGGASVAVIAAALHLSASTVKSHLESAYRKLGVSDRAAAVAVAMRAGLLR